MNSLIADKYKNVNFSDEQVAMVTETILTNDETKPILILINKHSTLIDENNKGISRKDLWENSGLLQYTFETVLHILLGATLIYQVKKGRGGKVFYQLTYRGGQVLEYMLLNNLI
ncbi:hypothetical protein HZI73_26105 (plasmid) [Vallitalea pronyensis]|uniref:Uncharacterized protein n=1 Tax=Vallitalea pronyensis TaxID=1348613 RepID=A0A8J8SJS7_9FIRM|nr:hypothetical protein [Vallitalea pronyensis]QUI25888.1 hypothetical protein HZI73_26105 [Vallitalea pronyensis]